MSSTPPRDRVASVSGWIMAYLDDHPDAADTAEGIRAVWLEGRASHAEVAAALEALAAAGRIAARLLPDGTLLFSRATGKDA